MGGLFWLRLVAIVWGIVCKVCKKDLEFHSGPVQYFGRSVDEWVNIFRLTAYRPVHNECVPVGVGLTPKYRAVVR